MFFRRAISAISKLPRAVNFKLAPGKDGHKLYYKMENTAKNILITRKSDNFNTLDAEKEIIQFIRSTYPNVNVITTGEPDSAGQRLENVHRLSRQDQRVLDLSKIVDLIITLGGDGTVIRTASMFKTRVPPMISFSMGTLGFLLPFRINY